MLDRNINLHMKSQNFRSYPHMERRILHGLEWIVLYKEEFKTLYSLIIVENIIQLLK